MNEEQRLFVADARDIVEKLDRDLEMYWRWKQRSASGSHARGVGPGESPFPEGAGVRPGTTVAVPL